MDGQRLRLITFSQELIDMIIDQLVGDRESLKRCSFVSRQWRPRCRYQLFKVVAFSDLQPGQSIERWCATFDVSDVLASLTHELRFHQEQRYWVRPTTLDPHLEHLSRFTNVTTLVFASLATSVFCPASLSGCFGSFVPTVRHLRLHRPITRPKSLVQLVLFFSTAIDIEIQYPRWSASEEDGLLLHQPLRRLGFTGTLYLRGFGERWSHFFALLSTERLRFWKTRLVGCEFCTSVPTQSFLGAISQNTRILHLVGSGYQRLFSNLTLHAFNALEGLAFKMTNVGIRGVELANLLDSISSRQLSVLALDVCGRENRYANHRGVLTKKFFDEMKALDLSLRRLAMRVLEGSGKRFTLILLASNPGAASEPFTEFRQVGNTWEGERVIGSRTGNDYYWTFRPAKDWENPEIDEGALRFLCT